MVKSHLTSAVNDEIVALKKQIKQLTEKCTRLEQENQILKKHALPETLALIAGTSNPQSSLSSTINNNNNQAVNINSSNSNQSLLSNNSSVSNKQMTNSTNLMNTINESNSNSVYESFGNELTRSAHHLINNEASTAIPPQDPMISSFTETNSNEYLLNDQSVNFFISNQVELSSSPSSNIIQIADNINKQTNLNDTNIK